MSGIPEIKAKTLIKEAEKNYVKTNQPEIYISKMEAYNEGQICKMVSASYQVPQHGSGETYTFPMPGIGGKFRCLMCSCTLVMKNKEIQKTENQTCNNLRHSLDFRSPSVPYVVCVLPPQILQNCLSTQCQGNKVGRKGMVEQRRLGIYRKDAQWEGFTLKENYIDKSLGRHELDA